MITSEQVEESFRDELLQLLSKWGATVEADDHFDGWPECGQNIKIIVDIPSVYDDDGNCIREYTEINLGKYLP